MDDVNKDIKFHVYISSSDTHVNHVVGEVHTVALTLLLRLRKTHNGPKIPLDHLDAGKEASQHSQPLPVPLWPPDRAGHYIVQLRFLT